MVSMSSAHIVILVLTLVLHAFAQSDTTHKDATTVSQKGTTLKQSDTVSNKPVSTTSEGDDVDDLLETIMREYSRYYSVPPKHTRATRTKRWAELDKRPGYYNGYSPYSSYTYNYPSNLMALLRGTKRGWNEPTRKWQYPSNLMVLLRGKKSVPEEDVHEEVQDEWEDEPSDIEQQAYENVMKRLSDGWKLFLESYVPKMSKRSAYDGYNVISRRPFGARQFMMWNQGRYVLG